MANEAIPSGVGTKKLQVFSLKGPKGDTGDTGPQGIQGVQGPKGDTGDTGPQGIQGVQGPKGEPFSIKKIYTSVNEMNEDFSNIEVSAGQFVLVNTGNVDDVDNAKLYVKTATEYSFITDLSGMQGIQGPQGDIGPQGLQGEQGPQGERGPQGIQGIRGPQGEKGDTGDRGPQGVQGNTGPQGPVGPMGPKGDTGPQGIQGVQGPRGYTGDTGPQGATGPQGEQGLRGPRGNAFTYEDFTEEQLAALTGPQGEKGEKGDTGEQGIQGNTGADGMPGVTPISEVPRIGRVMFDGTVDSVNSSIDAGGRWLCPGLIYEAIYDNVSYVLTAKLSIEMSCVYIGNLSLMDASLTDTGEPFCIFGSLDFMFTVTNTDFPSDLMVILNDSLVHSLKLIGRGDTLMYTPPSSYGVFAGYVDVQGNGTKSSVYTSPYPMMTAISYELLKQVVTVEPLPVNIRIGTLVFPSTIRLVDNTLVVGKHETDVETTGDDCPFWFIWVNNTLIYSVDRIYFGETVPNIYVELQNTLYNVPIGLDLNLTAEDVGAAPSGYGLGEDNGKEVLDANTATTIGFYRLAGASTLNCPLPYGVLLVERRHSYIYQTAKTKDGQHNLTCCVRCSTDYGTTWSEWEWVNPPMEIGVEYKTTKRINNLPVYMKYFGGDYIPAGGYLAVETGLSTSDIMTSIVGTARTDSNSATYHIGFGSDNQRIFAYRNGTKINIYSQGIGDSLIAAFVIEYVKS